MFLVFKFIFPEICIFIYLIIVFIDVFVILFIDVYITSHGAFKIFTEKPIF